MWYYTAELLGELVLAIPGPASPQIAPPLAIDI